MDVAMARGDGTKLQCHQAGSGKAAVIVLHPWWGLNADVVRLADRLAGEGFTVMAPDLFNGQRAATPDEAEKLVQRFDSESERLLADIERVAAYLRDQGASKLGVLGLSFGAAYAVALAAKDGVDAGVDAVVLYYGTGWLEEEDRVTAPVLGHFADEDPYEPDGGEALFEQLRDRGTSTEHYRYPGTYHWFVEPSDSHYNPEAAEMAFARTRAFLNRHLAG
ncbi:MAG: dienelactone hydrolase family protein [Clostridia bacterium]